MSYKALYRTYRPTTFEDVVGQDHIVKTLQHAIAQNKLAHAYLFCGPRGTGKTTVAKLLAKAVNCENPDKAPCNECANCNAANDGTHQDIIEIDAASNNGVDEIRDLIEKVKYAPIMGKYKVYIIDEVHMLSAGAFNALLKTLEEPPAHVIFILATTEPHKVLPTIISRCQRYDFAKVDDEDLIGRMKTVLEKEKITADDEALELIATLADGGMRDALSILDQCIAYAQDKITTKHINEIYGIATTEDKIQMVNNIFKQDAKSVLSKVQTFNTNGIDIRRLTNDLIEICKDCVVYAYTKDGDLLKALKEKQVKSILEGKPSSAFLKMIDILMDANNAYKISTNVTSYFEVTCLKMIDAVSTNNTQSPVIPTEVISSESDSFQLVKSADSIVPTVKITTPAKPTEEPKKKTTKKAKSDVHKLDGEYIVGLLVDCNKESKTNDLEKWKDLDSKCKDLKFAKYANLLKQAKIGASSNDCIILETAIPAIANEINDAKENYELFDFINSELGINKMIYAVDSTNWKAICADFKNRFDNNNLPPSSKVIKYEIENKINTEQTTEEKLTDLFGDDLLKVEDN